MEYLSSEKKKWQKKKEQINKSYPLRFADENEESGTEIGHSLEFDFVVPPPHSWVGL